MILLNAKETEKFAAYCHEQSANYEGLALQAGKVSGETTAKHLRSKAYAYRIIGDDLANTEAITIGEDQK